MLSPSEYFHVEITIVYLLKLCCISEMKEVNTCTIQISRAIFLGCDGAKESRKSLAEAAATRAVYIFVSLEPK